MAQTAQNVTAASPIATGGILVAPKGTALPTDTDTALNAAFVPLGYVGEGGIEPAGEGASYNDIKAWGGDIVTSVLETKSITKYKFTLLEVFTKAVADQVFGSTNVTFTAAAGAVPSKIAILDKGDEIPRRAYIFEMAYGAKKLRYCFPDAQMAVVGEGPLVHNDITNYQVEITAYPNSSGVRSYRYLKNDDPVS